MSVALLTAIVFMTISPARGAAAASTEILAYVAGDVAECNGRPPEKSAAARTAKMIPPDAVVFVVGDTTYPTADRATLEACYTPTWGRFLSRTYAVPGNHDYDQIQTALVEFGLGP